MLTLWHGNAIPGKEHEGIFSVNPALDGNLSSSKSLAEGAAVYDAVVNGLAQAFLYQIEVPPELVQEIGAACGHFIEYSSTPSLPHEERLEIINYGPALPVAEEQVPLTYANGRYVESQRQYAASHEVWGEHADFYFTHIPAEFVVSVEEVSPELIAVVRDTALAHLCDLANGKTLSDQI